MNFSDGDGTGDEGNEAAYLQLYVPRFLYKELPLTYNLTGMVFNIILITYFVKRKKYLIPTFTLLTSLAVTDMLSCISATGYGGLLHPFMPFPKAGFLCQLFTFSSCFSMVSSGYHLIFFAGLRFYQLVFPLPARARVTCGFVLKGCLIIQFFIVIFGLSFALNVAPTPTLSDGEMLTLCSFTGSLHGRDISWSVISTLIPCVSILVLHIAKYVGVAISSNASLHTDQDRTRNADARAVVIVIILFYIAWFVPNCYLLIQLNVENYDHFRDRLYLVFVQVSFSNSAMNPVVYCFAAKSVRDDLLDICCPNRKKPVDKRVRR